MSSHYAIAKSKSGYHYVVSVNGPEEPDKALAMMKSHGHAIVEQETSDDYIAQKKKVAELNKPGTEKDNDGPAALSDGLPDNGIPTDALNAL